MPFQSRHDHQIASNWSRPKKDTSSFYASPFVTEIAQTKNLGALPEAQSHIGQHKTPTSPNLMQLLSGASGFSHSLSSTHKLQAKESVTDRERSKRYKVATNKIHSINSSFLQPLSRRSIVHTLKATEHSPILQASFISFALKMGAKKGSQGMLKNFIKTKIKSRIKKFVNKKVAKQFLKEADEILGILTDPWWVTAIGFIPIAGDVFDLVNTPLQIRKAIKKADQLEAKVKNLMYWQWKLKRKLKIADPKKVLNVLNGFSGKNFKFGSSILKLDKKGIKHMLERHLPNFWNGSIKTSQSFFNPKMSVPDITSAIESILMLNHARIPRAGASRIVRQFEGVYNGVRYVVGVNKGRIGQFYRL